jgi:hypothetical protein
MSESSLPRLRLAGEHTAFDRKARWVRVACSSLIAAPLLFGIPVALGIAVSVVRLLAIRYPDLGWATTVNSDAEELFLGHTLYQSPAHGYTGQIYTPLFPAIVSLFDHLYLWNGWALLVVIAASVSLIALAARVAYARGGPLPRSVSVMGAAGIGCIAYWCVASVKLPVLHEARGDQLAWALALFGLIAVADLGPTPSRRRVAAAVLLLSAALWTKQTTAVLVGVAVAWVIGLAAVSAVSRKAALQLVVALCALNLAALLLLNLVTHGWEFYFNFEVATLQSNESPFSRNVTEGLQCVALALGFIVAAWLPSLARAARYRRGTYRSDASTPTSAPRRVLSAEDPTGRRVLLLFLYVVIGFVAAAYFMRKQGTETNQLIGVVWALGLLAAVGWRVAQRHTGSALAAGGCVALLFTLTQLGPVSHVATDAEVSIPALESAVQWRALPAAVLRYASDHTVYSPVHADLNVPNGGPLYPNYFNFVDLLAAGNQPLYLVRALLDRRFDAVGYFPLAGDLYASGNGKWEANYLWKLDEVIAARYVRSARVPGGLLERRPGPELAAWMRDCFGPFSAGGVDFRIRRGGGFWCSFEPQELQFVRAPVPLSEVVTTRPVRLAGAIVVSLPALVGTHLAFVLEGRSGAHWAARLSLAPGKPDDLLVSTYVGRVLLGSELARARMTPDGRRELRLGLTDARDHPGAPVDVGAGSVTLTAPAASAPLAVQSTSGVALDLQAADLDH